MVSADTTSPEEESPAPPVIWEFRIFMGRGEDEVWDFWLSENEW